jgi:transposase
VRTDATMTRSLLAMSDRLGQLGVTRVVMEATWEYWGAGVLPAGGHGFAAWLVNARDARAAAGAAQDRPPGRGVACQGR